MPAVILYSLARAAKSGGVGFWASGLFLALIIMEPFLAIGSNMAWILVN